MTFVPMLQRYLHRLFGNRDRQARDARADFETLNAGAPLKSERAGAQADTADEPDPPAGFICRETVLGRDQRVAGYQFMLQQSTQKRLRSSSRRIHHVYAEVLVRNVLKLDVAKLLGHRHAFLDVPDSFLEHPSIRELQPSRSVLTVHLLDEPDAPAPTALLESVRRLRKLGYRIAVDVSSVGAENAFLLPEADFAILRANEGSPERTDYAVMRLRTVNAGAKILARELPSQDDFQFFSGLGATYFQGPFITRREDWSGNAIGPNTARIAALLARLRRDADTHEIAQLLSQDAALSLRLMRYINSASIGLREEITSIERALLLLGREQLYRWLMLLIYSADKGTARSSALLESALVRARLMELLGKDRPEGERDALFLVGLLSLVDVILQVPIEKAMASLGTAPEIEAAVVRGEGPMAPLLRVAIACEQGHGELESAAAAAHIDAQAASRHHLEALAWAMQVSG